MGIAAPRQLAQRPTVLKHSDFPFISNAAKRVGHDKSVQGKQDSSPLWHLEMLQGAPTSKDRLIRHIQECFQGVRVAFPAGAEATDMNVLYYISSHLKMTKRNPKKVTIWKGSYSSGRNTSIDATKATSLPKSLGTLQSGFYSIQGKKDQVNTDTSNSTSLQDKIIR